MRYLVAVDDSVHSLYAFDYFVEQFVLTAADPRDDVIFLVAVAQDAHTALGLKLVAADWVEKANVAVVEQTEKTLEKFTARAREKGVPISVTPVIGRGKVRETLLEKCRDLEPDMVICGTRGLGTVKRAVLGSVSDFLVKQAPCPVLVVHRKPE